MPRYKLTVAYEGTAFHGWQKQEPRGCKPLRTAQGELEQAVRLVCREPIVLTGASRTDAGVHAIGQVAAFTTNREIPGDRLARAITSRCPNDLQVRRAVVVADDFDPIRDAVMKAYRYVVEFGGAGHDLPPLFDRRTVWWTHHTLDPNRMRDAARRLVGTHDFEGFAQASHGRESTVRTIHSCTVTEEGMHRVRIDVTGDGFLYNMVRIIAGTLVEVGRGHHEPEVIDHVLSTRSRHRSGPTLRPEGLCLMWILHDAAEAARRRSARANAGRDADARISDPTTDAPRDPV